MSGLIFTPSLLVLVVILSLSEGFFGGKKAYCGNELRQMIALMCDVYYDDKGTELSDNNIIHSSSSPMKIRKYEPDENGELPFIQEAEDECCRKPCSHKEIAKFCLIDTSRPKYDI